MNYIKCPKCQSEIEGDSYFCDQCGAELFVCPKCGTYGKGKCCTRCGEPLVAAKDMGKGAAAPETAKPTEQAATPADRSAGANVNSNVNGLAGGPAQATPSQQPKVVSAESSITSDIDRVLEGATPSHLMGAGGTVRPGNNPQPAAQQRQVPGHLVCRDPQLRLYIDDVLIGRREGGYASVFCAFGMVSGRHAQISRTPSGGWQVTDLGSTNGTRLNGRPLAPNIATPFWVGDVISFADKDFEAVP